MCTGKRRKASESSATVTIRDVFTTIAPSSATGYFILFFILVSIILLGVTLLPKTFIYETDFTDLNNLSQVDSDTKVTKILWGTWQACVVNTTSNTTLLCTGDHWISHPYNLTIKTGTNFQATVRKLWVQILFLQLVGLIFAVFIVIVLWMRMYLLARRSRQYNRDSAAGLRVEPEKERVCNLSNILAFLLWVWITAVVIGNGIVLTWIQNEMQLLGSGVTTKAALGFWLPVAADGFTLVTAALFFLLIKSKVNKGKEVEMKYTTT